jgi:cytidyltransferase-like protein
MNRKVVVLSGGFDPLHSGHLAMFEAADGDVVIVGVNSDDWLVRKKGFALLPRSERIALISGLKWVDHVIGFDDRDNTACDLIRQVYDMYGKTSEIIFANGGDRRVGVSIPEEPLCRELGVHLVDGVGGTHKMNSSSDIIKRYNEYLQTKNLTQRSWGQFTVLLSEPHLKVKKLVIYPNQRISLQYHFHRRESWTIVSGVARVTVGDAVSVRSAGSSVLIKEMEVHRLENAGKVPLVVIETQTGEYFEEDDIVRI